MLLSAKSAKPVVMVVEDEPLVRLVAVETIEDAGFEVVECADATDAVKVLETRDDIRIVFTDIDMPNGINGILLAALIRDRWPPIHLIVTSGHHIEKSVSLPPGTLFFAKPYRLADVSAAIVTLLRGLETQSGQSTA